MAKTGGRVKALREKAKQNAQRNRHGGYARFSAPSVETVETSGRYYSGDNNNHTVYDDDGKVIGIKTFWPIQQNSAFHKMARQGEIKYFFEATSFKDDRRDGGRANLIDTHRPIVSKDGQSFQAWKGPAKERLDKHRVSMGQPLIAANYAKPAANALYRKDTNGRLVRVG